MSTLMYQLTSGDTILRLSDGGLIPADPGNRDWADYQTWLAAGNTPEPAPPAPPPAPDYIAFWDALLLSGVYSAIREQSMVSLPMNTLGTEFIALIGDAKAGRAFPEAIQASMLAILATGNFTPEHISELEAALAAGHLDGIYTLEAP
jgi:hypothetical protein